MIVKLFSVSSSVASVVYNSKLLNLLEREISNTNDTLVTLTVLELLYEVCYKLVFFYAIASCPFLCVITIFFLICCLSGLVEISSPKVSKNLMSSEWENSEHLYYFKLLHYYPSKHRIIRVCLEPCFVVVMLMQKKIMEQN